MNKVIKVLLTFSRYADAKLESFCKIVMQAITGNANFPTPLPTLSAIQAALDNFGEALIAAASGNRVSVALKNQYRRELVALMRQLGNYINTVSDGNVAMLASSGFALSKFPEPRHLATPGTPVVKQGQNEGAMLMGIAAVKGATSYLHQVTPDPITKSTNWESVPSSRTKFEFTNLEQGQKYWFRVVAVGSNDQVAYSGEISQYVMKRGNGTA